MKTSIQFLFGVLILSVLLFTSCKKEPSPVNPKTNPDLAKLVVEWVNQQKLNNSAERIAKIEALQSHLEFNRGWTEMGNDNQKFIIIPVNESLQFVNNKNNKVSNYLVLTADPTGKPDIGYIIQNRTGRANTDLKEGVVSGISKGTHAIKDCSLTFITIYDRFLFESSYKDGSLHAVAVMDKNKNRTGTGPVATSASQCTDWFLVTTYYYSDGTTYQTSEYVGTTCGDCTIGDPLNQSLICDDGTGGGSGVLESNDYAAIVNDFNSYVQKNTSEVSMNAPTTNSSPDPVSGNFTWVVTKGLIANWRVEAITHYAYYNNSYFNLANNSFVRKYNLFEYHTLSSNYIGTNIAIETTWNQTMLSDQVLDNNTSATKGKSAISGTLRHRFRNPIPGFNVVLDITETASNTATFFPG
jgi:hypothetical protein